MFKEYGQYLISTICFQILIPEFFYWLLNFQCAKIQHFFCAKKTFENLQSMIGRQQFKFTYAYFALNGKFYCHNKIWQNINEDLYKQILHKFILIFWLNWKGFRQFRPCFSHVTAEVRFKCKHHCSICCIQTFFCFWL